MNVRKFIMLFLMGLLFSTQAQAQNKTEYSDKLEQCASLEHGAMLNCYLKSMGKIVNDVQMIDGKNEDASKEDLKNPVEANMKSIEVGKIFYQQNCQACHGVNGTGEDSILKEKNTNMNLTDVRLKELSDGQLMARIIEGGWPMPAFGFQSEWGKKELWDVINYLRTLTP